MKNNTVAMINIADREKFNAFLETSENVKYLYELQDIITLDEDHHILCMVVDFTTNHQSALEMVRHARSHCISAPLIPIFTRDQREIMLDVITLGVYDILIKPISKKNTSHILSKVISEQIIDEFTTEENPINNASEQLSELISVQKTESFLKYSKILLVDDSEGLSLLLEIIFKKYGCTLTCVDSGEKALTEFKKEKFDIVITDYSMPHMGGAEVTKAIREWEKENNTTTVPILALSAHEDGGSEEDAMKKVGCNAFISKTPSFSDLLSVVGNYIDQSYR